MPSHTYGSGAQTRTRTSRPRGATRRRHARQLQRRCARQLSTQHDAFSAGPNMLRNLCSSPPSLYLAMGSTFGRLYLRAAGVGRGQG